MVPQIRERGLPAIHQVCGLADDKKDAGPCGRLHGFTLVEILVALVVLSLVALAAVKASGNAVNNAYYLRQQTLAHWVAMNKAAELELSDQWPAFGNRSGAAVMAQSQWPWVVTGQQTPDPDIRRAEIAVWAGREEGDPLATLTVYVGRK